MALTKYFRDTFTDVDGTLITAHTPEQGLGWSVLAGSGGSNAQIDFDGANGTLVQPFYSPSARSWYVINTTEPETPLQQAEAVYGGATLRILLRANAGSSAPNAIIVEFSNSLSIVTINTLIEGVQSQIASKPATTVTTGDVCRVMIDESNDVYAWLNDTPIIWDSNGGLPNFNVTTVPANGKLGWVGVKSYTANGTDSFDGWYNAAGSTPIAFNGNIDNQTFTAGDSVNLDVSTFFSGTQTPFTFANIGASIASIGLSLSAAGIISGTAIEGSVTGVQIEGTDNDLNTVNSNLFNITVNAAAGLPPQGTVTVGTITVTDTTASVPFSYSDVDETGYVYRLNGGAPQAIGASPINLTGLTPDTAYTIDVAATNADGTGAYSSPVSSFTTDAAPVTAGVFTSEPLKDNTGQLLTLTLLDYVTLYDTTTNALVIKFTNITTDSNGVFTVTDDLIVQGTSYKADWQINTTGISRMPVKAAT